VALDSSSLLARRGPVTIALLAGDAPAGTFGRNEALAALAEYVTAAYADGRVAAIDDEATKDKAARAYALWQIYNDAYVAMLNRPASLTVAEKGSHAYSTAQLEGMKNLADRYQQEFEGLLPDEDTTAPAPTSAWVHGFLTF
jgi:hypothetical protein